MKNPILQKEMRVSARSLKITWGMFVFNTILAIIGLCMLRMYFYSSTGFLEVDYSWILEIYYVLQCVQIVCLAFMIPSITAGAIAGEREKQTLNILLTTPISTWNLVCGKLTAAVFNVGLFLVSSLPILSIVFLIGGVTVLQFVQYILYSFVFGFFLGSIGIFYSVAMRKTVVATIMTYGTLVVLCLGGFAVEWIASAFAMSVGKVTFLGKFLALGLLNPLNSVCSMLAQQTGSESLYQDVCLLDINKNSFWMQHVSMQQWFWSSIVVQILVAVLLVLVTSILLRPRKKMIL